MRSRAVRTKAVGVVVPVHNEEELLGLALGAVERAFSEVLHWDIECQTAIVLDSCTDDSPAIARRWARSLARREGPHQSVVLRCRSAGVGEARRAGAASLLRKWKMFNPRNIWLATTDADFAGSTRVAGRTGGRARVRGGRMDGAGDGRGLVTL